MDFDYNKLDAETRIRVKQRTSELQTLQGETARNIVEMGKRLAEIRGLVRWTRPGFQAWCKLEGWSLSSAYRCIHAYEQFGEYANFGTLSDSVLYLLAAPETPEQARTIILDAAESGEVGVAVAQGIINAQKLAMAATNKADPPTIDVNAAQDVADEIIASGHVTLADGRQVIPDEKTIIPAVHAAESERNARKGQHMDDSKPIIAATGSVGDVLRQVADALAGYEGDVRIVVRAASMERVS